MTGTHLLLLRTKITNKTPTKETREPNRQTPTTTTIHHLTMVLTKGVARETTTTTVYHHFIANATTNTQIGRTNRVMNVDKTQTLVRKPMELVGNFFRRGRFPGGHCGASYVGLYINFITKTT